MAVTIDVYGSCVSKDLFRYVRSGKYKFNRCITHTPITTLYEKGFELQLKNVEAMDLDQYEKAIIRVQTQKISPQLLKKKQIRYLNH
jgi:glutaredoxin